MSNGRSFKRKVGRRAPVKQVDPPSDGSTLVQGLKRIASGDEKFIAAVKAVDLGGLPPMPERPYEDDPERQERLETIMAQLLEDEGSAEMLARLTGKTEAV